MPIDSDAHATPLSFITVGEEDILDSSQSLDTRLWCVGNVDSVDRLDAIALP